MPLDKKCREELDEEFNRFLAFVDKLEAESQARLAESGERPIRMLVGVDHESKRVAVVLIEGSSPPPAIEDLRAL